jgi:hypothetical protein
MELAGVVPKVGSFAKEASIGVGSFEATETFADFGTPSDFVLFLDIATPFQANLTFLVILAFQVDPVFPYLADPSQASP